MKITIILAIIIVIGGIGSGYIVYQHNQETNDQARNTIIEAINHLKQSDNAINTLVLESRYGLNNDYDEIASLSNQLRKGTRQFQSGILFDYAQQSATIKQLLEVFNAQLNLKIELIESFKSHNSILRNSINYAPTLGDKLIQEIEKNLIIER